ncbi:hypothetical protein GCM10027067_23380 [Pseudactinotalea suaedae]
MRGALAVALATVALTAAGAATTTMTASAAPGDPFDPAAAAVFISQGRNATVLYTGVQAGPEFSYVEEGAGTHDYNGMGYNALDNYIYAISTEINHLIRIGQGGITEDLGPIAGLDGMQFNQGTFGAGDDAGTFFVRSQNDTSTVFAVDVTTVEAAAIVVDEDLPNFADLVYLDGYLWGVDGTSQIWRIDLGSGAVASWPIAVELASFGGQWLYGNGNLGLANNRTGEITQIEVSNAGADNPTFSIITTSQGPAWDTSTVNYDATSNLGADVDLSIEKSGPSSYIPGSTVTYYFNVTNHSDVASSGYYFQDLLPASMSNLSSPNDECSFEGNLMTCVDGRTAPGQFFTFMVTGTVTGTIETLTNTATVTGNENDPNPDNNTSTVTTPANYAPGVSVVKSAALPDGEPFATGGTLEYSFLVTNTGNTALTGIVVNEGDFTGTGDLGAIECPTTTLAPGASTTCTADYTLTQADVDAELITNSATVTGTPPFSPPITSTPSTFDYEDEAEDGLTLTKTALPATSGTVGEEITYSFDVTNTGGSTLTDVSIEEGAFSGTGDLGAITCPDAPLAPGTTMTCTAPYVLTQADIDADGVTNTATATGTPPGGGTIDSPPSSVTVETPDAPAMTLVKSATPTTAGTAGTEITYSFTLSNTGNVTLTDVHVDETEFTGTGDLSAVTCSSTALAPGASTTCTALYTLTQADVDNGGVTNTATGGGTPPGGGVTDTPPSTVTVDSPDDPSLTVAKSASPVGAAAGNPVTYSFLVTNTGNVTIDELAVVEVDFSGTGDLSAISCPATTLAPEATTTCTATYTLTQADVDSGSLENTAVATGNTPSGGRSDSPPSQVEVPLPPNPSLSVVKTATPATVDRAGEEVTYSFRVINTGNVTMSGITVQEQDFTGTGDLSEILCPVTTLAPAAETTCTATYVLTQEDVDARGVTNVATAAGTPPGSDTPVESPPSETTVGSDPAPGLSVVKTASPASASAVGDVITYGFLLTNTGNVTLSDVAPVEGEFSGSGELSAIECPVTVLAPGDDVTCTATYELTQEDVDAGAVTNVATGTGTPPGGGTPVEAPPSEIVVEVPSAPGITLVKTSDVEEITNAGDQVLYSFLVTNTGNVTLTEIVVDDGGFTGTGELDAIECPAVVLTPQESMTCEAAYVATQADVDSGLLSNTATVTGASPGTEAPPVTSPPSEVNIEAPHAPGIGLVKTSDAATITAVGQTVTYSFLVTNTGNVTLSSVAVTEGAFTGAGDLSEVACPETSLLPGEEIVCTASYTVQEADLTGAALSNTATASAAPPGDGTGGGDPITSDPSTSESGSVVLSEDLPTTGAQIGWGLALGALVLLLLGGALVLARHSRRGADEVLPH